MARITQSASRGADADEEETSTSQIVVMALDNRDVALRIEDVHEIIRMAAVSPLVEGPDWVAGVLNLRGVVMPIIDLRARLSLARAPYTADNAICVVSMNGRLLGLVADSASEVLTLPTESFTVPDEISGGDHPVSWVARAEDHGLIFVLDVDRLCDGTQDLVLPDFLPVIEDDHDVA